MKIDWIAVVASVIASLSLTLMLNSALQPTTKITIVPKEDPILQKGDLIIDTGEHGETQRLKTFANPASVQFTRFDIHVKGVIYDKRITKSCLINVSDPRVHIFEWFSFFPGSPHFIVKLMTLNLEPAEGDIQVTCWRPK